MIFPQSMMRLTAVILRSDIDSVTRSLLNAGVIDFVDAKSEEYALSHRLSGIHQDTTSSDIEELRHRIEQLMGQADIPAPQTDHLNADELEFVDPQKVVARLERLFAVVQGIREQQKQLQQQLNRKRELLRQVHLFDSIGAISSADSAVGLACGLLRKSCQNGFTQALSLYPAAVHVSRSDADELPVTLLYMKRDEHQINSILDRFGWHSIEFPSDLSGTRDDITDNLTEEIAGIEEEQRTLGRQAISVIVDERPYLEQTWKNLTITHHYVNIQDRFGRTAETVLFTGWVPAKLTEKTEKRLRSCTHGHCYIEWTRPEDDTSINMSAIPVKLEHSRFLKPFQWIVENYSLPQYGSVDPTVIVAISYLAMFGLMFGDAGHGVVIALVGGITAKVGRHHRTAFYLGRLLLWCGCASIVTGVLFGSYFGYALFGPVWFDYHGIVMGHTSPGLINDIYDILRITIYFGIAIIGCGIVLNMVNHLRAKRFGNFVFDKGGLLGGWFYAGGIYAAFFFARSDYREFPPMPLLAVTLFLPSILFFFKPIVSFMATRNANESSPKKTFRPMLLTDWTMEWVVELLELFSGYLSNTLSFMRIAGLGIAHVSLMTAFFQIADQIASPLLSGVVLVLGNLLVIALEGLSAAIQSLRLNYYEFFSRYFRGSGKIYHPISLRKQSS